MRSVRVRGVGGRTAETESAIPDGITWQARSCRVREGRPRNRAIWVNDWLGKVIRLPQVQGVLFKRVRVTTVNGMKGAHDGVGHGSGIIGGEAKADRIAIQNLVEEGRHEERVRAGIQDGCLERTGRVCWPDHLPHKCNHSAPRPQMLGAGLSAATERTRQIRARQQLEDPTAR